MPLYQPLPLRCRSQNPSKLVEKSQNHPSSSSLPVERCIKKCHYRFQSDALLHIEIDHIRTSHLGDSGMKNRPGINNVQGKVPKRMDVEDLHQRELPEIN
jgi:hypothetical protein